MTDAKASNELDIRAYLRVLRRRWWIIVLVPAVTASVAYFSADSKTRLYSTSAEILIARTQAEVLFDPLRGGYIDPDRLLANQVRVIQSQDVAEIARTDEPAIGGVSASFSETEDVITLSAVDADPERAARTVNAYARAYLEHRRQNEAEQNQVAQDEILRQIGAIDARLLVLDAEVADAPAAQRESVSSRQASERGSLQNQRVSLQSQLTQLQAAVNVSRGGAQLLAPAPVPSSPFEPNPRQSGSLGLLVGLMLAAGLAFLLDFLDDRVRSKDDLDRAAPGLPVLGLLPRVPTWKNRKEAHLPTIEEPMGGAAEAYRSLRTSIQFLGLDRPLRTLQVTSPAAAEGKTTTLTNLAVALARAGQEVVVVDADLRRPRVHAFFGIAPDIGLTSVMLGDVPLSGALRHVPGVERLRVLPSGPIPPNPSELLAGGRAVEVLAALQAAADIVLIDSPPVLPVSDASVLSARVDATLLVVNADKTHRKHVARALEILGQVDARVIGVALNGIGKGGAYGYSYSYGYGSAEQAPVPNGTAAVGAVDQPDRV